MEHRTSAGACLLMMTFAVLFTSTHAWPELVGKVKVTGPGVSVTTKSLKDCLNLCHKKPTCDALNFHATTNKCRLFPRCSPTRTGFNSSKHFLYAKRPLVQDKGFVYDEISDSCLKLVDKVTTFAEAEKHCHEQNGRLVVLHDPRINKKVSELLKSSQAQYAWIGLTDARREGDPMHVDGTRVSETGYFPTGKQTHRNDPTRNCWAVSDSGEWAEHSCKDRQQYSICQIASFD